VIAAEQIASTPLTGWISYAIVASAIGEDQLEGESGLTTIGWIAIAVPALIGLFVLLWSFSTVPMPNTKALAIGLAVAGVILAIVGTVALSEASEADDVSIGGALILMLVGPFLGLAIVLWLRQRSDSSAGNDQR